MERRTTPAGASGLRHAVGSGRQAAGGCAGGSGCCGRPRRPGRLRVGARYGATPRAPRLQALGHAPCPGGGGWGGVTRLTLQLGGPAARLVADGGVEAEGGADATLGGRQNGLNQTPQERLPGPLDGFGAGLCNRSAAAVVVVEAAGVRLTTVSCGRRTRHANPTAGKLMWMHDAIGPWSPRPPGGGSRGLARPRPPARATPLFFYQLPAERAHAHCRGLKHAPYHRAALSRGTGD
jgi:hypothetical protein